MSRRGEITERYVTMFKADKPGEGRNRRHVVTRLVLIGAAPDTDNLGVSALCWSTVSGVLSRRPDCRLTVFDFGRGTREDSVTVNGGLHSITRSGAAHTRRLYRPESLWRIRLAARLGGLSNPSARAIRQADAVLDVSGGDSFTDLYGPWRFRSIILPKLIALENRRPLILLPQTYGPFRDPRHRAVAQRILRGAKSVWTRDLRSLDVLTDLLGVDFDPQRHRGGVDLAFGLQPRRPKLLPPSLASLLDDRQEPLVGVNVSGLLYRNPEAAKHQYRLTADYRAVVRLLLNWFLRKTTARLVLVPHVISPPDHYESDVGAIREVIETLEPPDLERVVEAPALTDPAEAKWLISRLDWFCGTRMHSTIAGLSTGVPSAAIAYSDKTLGVFEMCGLGEHVADPRHLDTEGVVEAVGESWLRREIARQELTARLPRVFQMAQDQMDDIMSSFDSRAGDRVV